MQNDFNEIESKYKSIKKKLKKEKEENERLKNEKTATFEGNKFEMEELVNSKEQLIQQQN